MIPFEKGVRNIPLLWECRYIPCIHFKVASLVLHRQVSGDVCSWFWYHRVWQWRAWLCLLLFKVFYVDFTKEFVKGFIWWDQNLFPYVCPQVFVVQSMYHALSSMTFMLWLLCEAQNLFGNVPNVAVRKRPQLIEGPSSCTTPKVLCFIDRETRNNQSPFKGTRLHHTLHCPLPRWAHDQL